MNLHPLIAAVLLAVVTSPSIAATPSLECTRLADEKRLVGAAKSSYLRKCEADADGGVLGSCQRAAESKKLAGATRNGHIKRCLADNTKKG